MIHFRTVFYKMIRVLIYCIVMLKCDKKETTWVEGDLFRCIVLHSSHLNKIHGYDPLY